MTAHRITPSFSIERTGDKLTVQTGHSKPLALIFGTVDGTTSSALRALADEIDRGGPVMYSEHDGQGGLDL